KATSSMEAAGGNHWYKQRVYICDLIVWRRRRLRKKTSAKERISAKRRRSRTAAKTANKTPLPTTTT
ncbi:hypothetical protein A2U01_0071185, partial [Trifolium medium]|nr:hypothetical protein [Trifolium medium]